MSINEKLAKTIASLEKQLGSVRTGRANPDLLSRIKVEYYGAMTPLNQVASITVPENTMLLINVFDKAAVQSVEKAIQTSDLGINPQVDGANIRLRLPDLTEDRRKELVKQVGKIGEDAKISIRNIRRDELDLIKLQEKDKDISEDEARKASDDIQKAVDQFMKTIDELISKKEEEILKIQ